MSKTYILEPVEVTFEEGVTGMDVPVDDPNAILDAISEGTVIEFSGTKLKFAGRDEGTALFTPDGTIPEYEPEHWANVNPPIDSASVILITYNDHGTFTVSIYTETEDEDTKPYIDEKLSKNVTYTDHPHNNWEEVLSKKGDPKTGYNTIEKLASSTSEGGSSDGGTKAFDAFYIDGYPDQITVAPNDFDVNKMYMLLIPNYSLENGEFGLIYFADGSYSVNVFKDIGSVSGEDPQGLEPKNITIAPEKTCHVVALDGGLVVVLTSLDDIVYGTSDGTSDVTPK